MSKERETRRHRREVTGGLEQELWQVRGLKVSAKGYRISSGSGENTLVRQLGSVAQLCKVPQTGIRAVFRGKLSSGVQLKQCRAVVCAALAGNLLTASLHPKSALQCS